MKPRITCLIPFYNEGDRILKVLEQVIKIREINEIFCVNDGSTDNTSELVKKNYPDIKIINLPQNLGKSEAVNEGLQYSKDEYILLIDADLRNLDPKEIANAINKILNNSNVYMIVLRRINAPFFMRFIRGDILVPGERILRKEDLQKILSSKPKGYQLEFAINKYMLDNNKSVYWMPSSALNTYPNMKFGILKGLKKTILMNVNIVSYLGFFNYLKQVLFFCRHKLD